VRKDDHGGNISNVGIVSWIVWGFLVGLFARGVRPGRQAIGCWWTIALGIVGSLLGGFLATEVLDIADADEFDFGSFLIAVATSAILLAFWERYERRRAPS
jgi:uncharacterized membrane protein YeaQ/YmgE (transglycosylase-associated protein family)